MREIFILFTVFFLTTQTLAVDKSVKQYDNNGKFFLVVLPEVWVYIYNNFSNLYVSLALGLLNKDINKYFLKATKKIYLRKDPVNNNTYDIYKHVFTNNIFKQNFKKADLLKKYPNIQELKINGQFSQNLIDKFKQLSSLAIDDKFLTIKDLNKFTKLKKLQLIKIKLKDNPNDVIQGLSICTNLESLLIFPSITLPLNASFLSSLINIKNLSLINTNLMRDDNDKVHISSLTNLTNLSLIDSGFDTSHIGKLTNLRSLEIKWPKVVNLNVRFLLELTNLQKLDCSNLHIVFNGKYSDFFSRLQKLKTFKVFSIEQGALPFILFGKYAGREFTILNEVMSSNFEDIIKETQDFIDYNNSNKDLLLFSKDKILKPNNKLIIKLQTIGVGPNQALNFLKRIYQIYLHRLQQNAH